MTRSNISLLGIAIVSTLLVSGTANAQFRFGGVKIGGGSIGLRGKGFSIGQKSSQRSKSKSSFQNVATQVLRGASIGNSVARRTGIVNPGHRHAPRRQPLTICHTKPAPIVQPAPIQGPGVPQPMTDADYALQLTYQAQDAFANQDYQSSIKIMDRVVEISPNSSSAFQFRALSYFAIGDYDQAAADVYDALMLGPLWTWDVVHPLYRDASLYTQQYRSLSSSAKVDGESMSKHFVLAYHHLVLGHLAHGEKELEKVLAIEPEEQVTQQLLAAVQQRSSNL